MQDWQIKKMKLLVYPTQRPGYHTGLAGRRCRRKKRTTVERDHHEYSRHKSRCYLINSRTQR